MNSDELRKLFPNISEDCIRQTLGVAGIPDPERKPDQRSQGQDRKLEKGTQGVGFRIALISIRQRLVDGHDNLRQGAKPLVDAITRFLDFASDSDPRLRWEYHQLIGNPRGTIVLIERL